MSAPPRPRTSALKKKDNDVDPFLQMMENKAQNQRCGLFSQPPPLFLGDTTYAKPPNPKDQLPHKAAPKNFLVNPPKTGKTASDFFTCPAYVIKDKYEGYEDPFRRTAKYEKERNAKIQGKPFKVSNPAKDTQLEFRIYPHVPEGETKKKSKRNTNGDVIFEPKNFVVPPCKKGLTMGELFLSFEHVEDPFSRKEEFAMKEKLIERAKRRTHKPFMTAGPSGKLFTPDYGVYGKSRAADAARARKVKHIYERLENREYPFDQSKDRDDRR